MGTPLESIPWARRLKLRHLEVFLAVQRTGSLTGAAAELHMTQPALSHWLADVEDVVGSPLFLRNRRLDLTPAGEVLLAHAARMLGDVQRTDAELRSVQDGRVGRLHVGTGQPQVLLPRTIERLHHAWPGIFISVLEAPLPDLLDHLARREVDVVIGALSAQVLAADFASEPLMPDVVRIVARCGHPALQSGAAQWPQLLQHPWILPPVGSVMRQVFDAAVAREHVKPPVPCVEANSSLRVHLLMGERDYLSILSGSELALYQSRKVLDEVPLPIAMPFPDVAAIWERERESRVLQHFLAALRQESRSTG